MSIQNLPRWFSLSDGTVTYQATLYEAMSYSQDISPLGGYSTLRMLNGAALKQTNWVKNAVSISGNGGIPMGMGDLNFGLPITLLCGAPRAIVRATNSFSGMPAHRTDSGYEPYILKYVDGIWIPVAQSGIATKYMYVYYPQLTCFFEPPKESYSWDQASPATWSLTGEEI